MGLTVQNIGVRALSLPRVVSRRAAVEPVGVPQGMTGWTWASLDDRHFQETGELDALAAEAGLETSGPVLGVSIHDSDFAYVVGADASGVRFRVLVNPRAFEDEAGPQDLEPAAAWASEHAPLDPSPEALSEVIARDFVFAEEGLDVLFARMGLLPADAAEGVEELPDDAVDAVSLWSELTGVDAPEAISFGGERWYALVRHGELSAHALAAEAALEVLHVEPGSDPWTEAREGVSGFLVGSDKIVFLGTVETRERLAQDLLRQGATVGAWEDVPEHVEGNLRATADWILRA